MKTNKYIIRISGAFAAFIIMLNISNAQQQMKINTQTQVLQLPSKATVTTDPASVTSCEGGTAIFNITASGDAPITFQWLYNGSPLPNTDGTLMLGPVGVSEAGSYQCVATNGCGSDTSSAAILTVNTLPVIFNVTGGGSYCVGGAGATVTLDGSESGVEYQLMIDNIPSGGQISGTGSPILWSNQTTAGQYTISAINTTTGCTVDMSGFVMVYSSPVPFVNVVSSSDPLCFGVCDGSVGFEATGAAPFLYDIGSQNNSVGLFSGLCDGIYTVTVTDNNGCTNTGSATLTQPAQLTVTASVSAGITCYGICDGSATAAPSGGVPSYTYLWNTVPAQNLPTASGLCAGSYIVSVVDASGCISSSAVTVTQPDTLILNAALNDASCLNDDGQILTSPTGGTLPYDFIWSNGMTVSDIFGLSSGTYLQTVTDINGCVSIDTYIINQASVNPVVKGQVSYTGGTFGAGEAVVTLYNEIDFPTGSMVYEYFGETITGAAGYEIQLVPDIYILQAALSNPSAYPGVFSTYYSLTPVVFTNNWEDAEPLTLGCDDTLNVSVLMGENPNVVAGTVTFSGIILYWDNGTKGVTAGGDREVGEPVEGAEIFIEQQPNDEPVANGSTGTDGTYDINGIAEGFTYDMTVDIPGIPLLSTYSGIVVGAGATVVENLNFFVDTTTTIGGIFIDSAMGVASLFPQLRHLDIFPNPATEKLFVEIESVSETDLRIVINDMSGKPVATLMNEKTKTGKKTYELKLSGTAKGNYILSATIGNDVFIRKFVLE